MDVLYNSMRLFLCNVPRKTFALAPPAGPMTNVRSVIFLPGSGTATSFTVGQPRNTFYKIENGERTNISESSLKFFTESSSRSKGKTGGNGWLPRGILNSM